MVDMCCSTTIPFVTSVANNTTDLTSANLPGPAGLTTVKGNIVLSFTILTFSAIIPIGIAIPNRLRGQRKIWKML